MSRCSNICGAEAWKGVKMNTTTLDSKIAVIARRELHFYKGLFFIGALWNLLGAVFGYFDTAETYRSFFGVALSDPLQFAIYRGSWGTTLLYFLGYLMVASNPEKHTGIVAIGTLGKVFFAWKLLSLYSAGLAQPIVLIVVIGDAIFAALFALYLVRMVMAHRAL
ncbi:MAG TPA: hypothetical protein DEA96_16485 [Leptospiraceae bacterium]|nr:hypothetical protein [Spirochaetaceae bacterium]HBS06568.1 hypothetical protein [Leptospiraceae bacterium]